MAIDTDLVRLLADAEPDESGALTDAKSAAGALNALFSGYRAQKDFARGEQVKALLDQQVPRRTLKRIFGTADIPMSLAGLKELSSSGAAGLLKDPNTDLRTIAILSSGGDPTKASKLMKIFEGEDDDSVRVTPAAVSAARLLSPKEVSGSDSAAELRILANNLQEELKGDIPETRRLLVMENLDQVNNRLAQLSKINLKKPAPQTPKPTAKSTGLSAEEAAAIKALSDALK